jgi:hypothetical protein
MCGIRNLGDGSVDRVESADRQAFGESWSRLLVGRCRPLSISAIACSFLYLLRCCGATAEGNPMVRSSTLETHFKNEPV